MSIKYVESSKVPREVILKDKLTEHSQKIAKSQRCLIISSIVAVIFAALSIAIFVQNIGGTHRYVALGATSGAIALIAIGSAVFFLIKKIRETHKLDNEIHLFSPKEILDKYLSMEITNDSDFKSPNRERNNLILEMTPESLKFFILFISKPENVRLVSEKQMTLFLKILENINKYVYGFREKDQIGQDVNRSIRFQQIKEMVTDQEKSAPLFDLIENIQKITLNTNLFMSGNTLESYGKKS